MGTRRDGQVMTVFLVIFVVLLLLFCALCYASYTAGEQAKSSLKKVDSQTIAAQNKQKELKERLAQISNLIGYHIPLSEGGNFRSDPEVIIYQLDTICNDAPGPNTRSSLGLQKFIEAKQIDKENLIGQKPNPELNAKKEELLEKLADISFVREINTLEDVWVACGKRVEQLQQDILQTQQTLKKEQQQYKETSTNTANEITRLHEEIQSKRAGIEDSRKSFEQRVQNAEKERNLVNESKTREKNKVAELVRKLRLQKSKYKSELENLDERIHELQAEAAGQTGIERWFRKQAKSQQVQESPDGKIIHVNNGNKIAYIDLGRAEGVLRGMMFQVFRYGKGGVKNYKGKIVIREVNDNMSKVGIEEINNALNPLSQGDLIINRVYDRNKVKYFAIAGKLSQKYSFEQVMRMVTRIGGKIEQQITARTDIVVLCEGFREDPLYQLALERGIETMLEAEFLGYLSD